MPLNLIKLCVGVDKVEQLVSWNQRNLRAGHPTFITTRQTPKRASEIEDGGALYWVIKGVVQARQVVLSIETETSAGQTRCQIFLSPEVIRTAPMPRKAFQGWRYLDQKDAPADLSRLEAEGLPGELAQELRLIGAW